VDGGGDPNLMQSFAELPEGQANARCQTCHTWQEQRFWPAGAHSRAGVSCVSCHAVHRAEGPNPALLRQADELSTCFSCHGVMRTRTWKSSHMPVREGKLSCGDCHNPHGSASERMLRDPSSQENCYRCHAEKRGPTLFEHPPVRENCMNCHDPHGSSHKPLLLVKKPLLCQRCHSNQFHPSTLYALTPAQQAAGVSVYSQQPQNFYRGCTNCHVAVHGSNSPSGKFWHR
jgi:DmsE family decaheme c-type cytochrome